MTPAQRLNRISEEGLCIGCGLCEAIAGKDAIQIARTPEGALRPIPQAGLDHAAVDQIYLTCPGTRMEGLPDRLLDTETKTDLVWGPIHRIAVGHASEEKVRFQGATGGVLSALALYLLQEKQVDFILHARASEKHPSFGEATISRTRADVMAAAGSRYGPTATLIGLEEALQTGERFAVIGTPCDITGLRNAATLDPRIDAQVPYMLAMVCGGFMETPAFEKRLVANGADPTQLKSVRYRGYGCPGPTRVEHTDGSVVEFTYLDMWGEDDSAWSLPFRCKICPDGIGEACDVAASDIWPGGAPTDEEATNHSHDPGDNALLMRSDAGRTLVEGAARTGYLTLTEDVGPRQMDDFQPHQVKKKHAAWSRHMGILAAGGMAPTTARLRLPELAAARGPADIKAQASGTRNRVLAGKSRETTPREG